MNTTHHHTQSTADLRAYGLPGIELTRARERREAELERDHIAARLGRGTGPLHGARQAIGMALLRLGAGIAGEAATSPRVTPPTAPKVDLA